MMPGYVPTDSPSSQHQAGDSALPMVPLEDVACVQISCSHPQTHSTDVKKSSGDRICGLQGKCY